MSLLSAEGQRILERLSAELERRGITAEEIGRLSRLSMWQTVTKDNDGEAQVHDLYGFQLAPTWDDGPQWPVITPGPVVKVSGSKLASRRGDASEVVAVLPDMQIGYYRHPDGSLEPTHDPHAIDAALALCAELRPDRIVLVGDNLDLPDFSRFRTTPAFQQTTQPAIDYATTLMARLRATTSGQIDWLAGNHEERLQHWLADNAKAAFGLRQGASAPPSWPVLSVPHLCRLDDHAVTYHPGYPVADIWLTDNLKVIHGTRVKSRGSTAHVYLDEQKVSVIYGHIHRREIAYRTREDIDGPAEIMAASPGCLARIDGAVPSTGQGLDLDGRPLTSVENWQQGVGVVTIHEDRTWQYEQARISNGRAWWRGKAYGP
jgi:predicted phosphodiesterase